MYVVKKTRLLFNPALEYSNTTAICISSNSSDKSWRSWDSLGRVNLRDPSNKDHLRLVSP
uniref:Uncharacterized protein n=1 Tax=Solanum lycopersicum TaxID=4081 RepID=A0A3Q7FQ20_SOLLC